MTPPSGSSVPGVTGYMFTPSLMKRDCHYVLYGPYSPLSTINWFSDNTSAVTVDSAGNETTVFPGSGNIVAQWQEVVGYNYSCAQIYANVATGARCDVRPRIDSISPDRGAVAATVSVLIFGSGFSSNSTVAVSGYGVTVSGVNFLPSGVLTANFQMTPDASAGNHAVTVTTNIFTSDSVNFFVQVPSRLLPLDTPQTPSGIGPLMTPVNQDVVSLAGQVVIQHACGVYRNYAFFLADQSGQRIYTYFVLEEAFSNYSSPTNLPPPTTVTTSYGPNDNIGDLHLLAFIYPDCLQSNDYQTFTQKFTITINSTKYYPSTTINITRGNVAGTLKVDRTITTP